MSTKPITVRPDADCRAALQLMRGRRIRRLPVVDAAGRLVGIVAERDLVLAAAQHATSAVEVGQVMSTGVVTATVDMPLTEVAATMIDRKIGGLPVVDARGGVIGVITETDIFKAFVLLHRGHPPARHASRVAGRASLGAAPAAKKTAARRPAAKKAPAKQAAAKRPAARRKAA
jgi:acetoin utilization protein AcuB